MAKENKYGISEVADGLSDLAELEVYIRDQVADGVQLVDAFNVGLAAYPVGKEFINDFPVFKAEITDIVRGEPAQILDALQGRLSPEDYERSSIVAAVDAIGYGHELALDTIDRTQILLKKFAGIIK